MKTVIIVIATVILGALGTEASAQEKMVVIVNNNNPVPTLTASQVKLYYLRRLKRLWPTTNKPIKPVDFDKGSKLKEQFYAEVLGMQSTEVVNYFKQRQYANSETPPEQLGSDEDVIRFVSENEGAIGYISMSAYQSAKGKVKSILNL